MEDVQGQGHGRGHGELRTHTHARTHAHCHTLPLPIGLTHAPRVHTHLHSNMLVQAATNSKWRSCTQSRADWRTWWDGFLISLLTPGPSHCPLPRLLFLNGFFFLYYLGINSHQTPHPALYHFWQPTVAVLKTARPQMTSLPSLEIYRLVQRSPCTWILYSMNS